MTLFQASLQGNILDLCTLDSLNSSDKISLCRSFHHLLHQHGEFHEGICWDIMTLMVNEKDSASYEDLELDDLRFATMYAVGERQAKRIAMVVMRSRRKDWFLSYLIYYDLHINDEYYDFQWSLSMTPPLLHAITIRNNSLLVFLVEECNADVNVKVSYHHQTALMFASDFSLPSSTMKCLLDHGADVSAVDKNGLTALDHAASKLRRGKYLDSWDIVTMLLQAGAEFGPNTSYTIATRPSMIHIVQTKLCRCWR